MKRLTLVPQANATTVAATTETTLAVLSWLSDILSLGGEKGLTALESQ